jgi:hypothetical protein
MSAGILQSHGLHICLSDDFDPSLLKPVRGVVGSGCGGKAFKPDDMKFTALLQVVAVAWHAGHSVNFFHQASQWCQSHALLISAKNRMSHN